MNLYYTCMPLTSLTSHLRCSYTQGLNLNFPLQFRQNVRQWMANVTPVLGIKIITISVSCNSTHQTSTVPLSCVWPLAFFSSHSCRLAGFKHGADRCTEVNYVLSVPSMRMSVRWWTAWKTFSWRSWGCKMARVMYAMSLVVQWLRLKCFITWIYAGSIW